MIKVNSKFPLSFDPLYIPAVLDDSQDTETLIMFPKKLVNISGFITYTSKDGGTNTHAITGIGGAAGQNCVTTAGDLNPSVFQTILVNFSNANIVFFDGSVFSKGTFTCIFTQF